MKEPTRKTLSEEVVEEALDDYDRLRAAQEIYWMRVEYLGISRREFAEILGWDEETVDDVEHGDFEEPGAEKLVWVSKRIQDWQEAKDQTEEPHPEPISSLEKLRQTKGKTLTV